MLEIFNDHFELDKTNSGLNSHFEFDTTKPYKEYIKYYRDIIMRARVDLENPRFSKEQIIGWNAPFVLEPDRNRYPTIDHGILLIHGFTANPLSMRDMAEFYQSNGFLVYGLLLPGHGTRSGDLRKIKNKDWIAAVKYGVEQLKKHAKKIYIGGHSTGGLLAVNHVLSNPGDKISGLVLHAPAFAIPGGAKWARVASLFKTFVYEKPDGSVSHYQAIALHAVAELYALTQKVKNKLKGNSALRKLPVFAVNCYEDTTLDIQESLQIFLDHTNPDTRKLLLYSSTTVPNAISEQAGVHVHSNKHYPSNILSQSHNSITNSQSNVYFGKNGYYRACRHYLDDKDKYSECQTLPDINFGEITEEYLKKGLLARQLYNPEFAEMMSEIMTYHKV